ncbi:MAG: LysR family transcriptional regulator [Rhodobacteraceae bacterium]|nr:LysR family transcriptional regulator [Paracoccaceae bacterium]
MNWQDLNFDWNQARAFLATVEEGSLSAAARALGLTQPTLGRQVAALEQKLGVLLFERVGRSLVLTHSGLELLDHVRAMADAANLMSLTASGQVQSIDGQVRITASDVMSAYVLPPALKKLRGIAPQLEIEIVATDDLRDLQRREADIAIRHVRPEQPDLIARLLREDTAHFYASEEYLNKNGCPETTGDLASHDFVRFGDIDRILEYLDAIGISLTRKNFCVGSDSGVVSWQMVRQGLGITVMSDEVALQTPGIVQLLPFMKPIQFPIWLVTHRELHTSRRIRLVFDVLAECFSRKPE